MRSLSKVAYEKGTAILQSSIKVNHGATATGHVRHVDGVRLQDKTVDFHEGYFALRSVTFTGGSNKKRGAIYSLCQDSIPEST